MVSEHKMFNQCFKHWWYGKEWPGHEVSSLWWLGLLITAPCPCLWPQPCASTHCLLSPSLWTVVSVLLVPSQSPMTISSLILLKNSEKGNSVNPQTAYNFWQFFLINSWFFKWWWWPEMRGLTKSWSWFNGNLMPLWNNWDSHSDHPLSYTFCALPFLNKHATGSEFPLDFSFFLSFDTIAPTTSKLRIASAEPLWSELDHGDDPLPLKLALKFQNTEGEGGMGLAGYIIPVSMH